MLRCCAGVVLCVQVARCVCVQRVVLCCDSVVQMLVAQVAWEVSPCVILYRVKLSSSNLLPTKMLVAQVAKHSRGNSFILFQVYFLHCHTLKENIRPDLN